MRTAQEIFEFVAKHLFNQGKAARGDLGCFYHIKKGKKVLKCAIGCLIPSDAYSPLLEGKSVKSFACADQFAHRPSEYKAIVKLNKAVPELGEYQERPGFGVISIQTSLMICTFQVPS